MPIRHTCVVCPGDFLDLGDVLDHIDTQHDGNLGYHQTVFTPQALAQGNPVRRIAWCPSCDRRHDLDHDPCVR